MDTIYVIIYGSKICRDSDEIKGYVASKAEAKAMVKKLNLLDDSSSNEYSWEEVNPLNGRN